MVMAGDIASFKSISWLMGRCGWNERKHADGTRGACPGRSDVFEYAGAGYRFPAMPASGKCFNPGSRPATRAAAS
jgi:hypothetical protein